MKKSSKVKIGNIELEIGGKVIKLKLEEAKELKDILNDTFSEKEYIPGIPIVIDRPVYTKPYRHWDWSTPECGVVLQIYG